MLGVKIGIISSSWYIGGPSGRPSISALLWVSVSSPNFKAACFLKEADCVGMAFVLLKGNVSVEYMSLHALNFLLPTDALLLCLAAANSAKRLMALSAMSP